MHYFLEDLSHRLLEKYPDITGELCVVTPNRRAGLFLQKHFASQVKKPLWAPDFFSIEDFINRISGFRVMDRMALLFEFYRVYHAIEKDKAEDMDRFLSWAPTLLGDFDDIDSSVADRKQLFEYLSDIKYIETWNPDGAPLSLFQENYLSFIRKLGLYHEALANDLLQKGMAWQGLSSRFAAEKMRSGPVEEISWHKVIFAGFNALTQAEETIIQALLNEGKAEYITDEDPYYTKNEQHEAGRFIRKYHKKFSVATKDTVESCFKTVPKKIRIMGIARNVNQARLAGNLLQHTGDLTADERTAVVLADEALLIPLLNALPPGVKEINITMGFPLVKTNMYQFFDSLFHLFLHGVTEDSQGTVRFYHKDLQRLFSQGLTALLWDVEQGRRLCTNLLQRLNASNQSFCTFRDLASLSGEPERFETTFGFLQSTFHRQTAGVFPVMLALTKSFDELFRSKAAAQGGDVLQTPYFVDFESLYYFARMFRKLDGWLKDMPFPAPLKTLYRLVKQAAAETKLSFSGEPLEGLQLMGMLETRSLDFRNVLLLSSNENILPKPKSNQSFIPFEVRKAYGLRVYHEQDAIFSYHFYRLLQRAENIYLIYNTQTGDIGSSEKSRFITQLQYELPKYNPGVDLKEEIIPLPPPVGKASTAVTIEKTEDIVKRLQAMAAKGFSPSALSTYINCPLQFYFEKVVSIKEAEEVEETMEAATIGSVAHMVLEMLYQPCVGRTLLKEDIAEMETRIDRCLDTAFHENYTGGNLSFGKNLLLYHLVKRYIQNILSAEKHALAAAAGRNESVRILALEAELKAALPGRAQEYQGQVLIRGLADRIDRIGSVVRIIDYKTGRIGSSELSFKEWDIPFQKAGKQKNFQLLCYAWLYHKMHPGEPELEPGIVSLRHPGLGAQTMTHPGGKGVVTRDHLLLFENHLEALLAEIMDAAQPFTQTRDHDNCRYCAFKALCQRHS